MKKWMVFGIVFAVIFIFGFDAAFAGNGAPSGSHFQFNILGKKGKGTSADDSSGRTIMIPLKTTPGPSNFSGCDTAQENGGVYFVDDIWPNYQSTVPAGNAKLYFDVCQSCTSFEITDRNAIDDGVARINVPASMLDATTKGILFDVYIRVMGKPLQCMEINGYAYDGAYYFHSGTVYLSKKARTTFTQINDLFNVYYCDYDVSPSENTTCNNEISVFSDVFASYFWNILNDGTKIVQVRIYARPQ
jgi:hypothetical protein